MRPQPWSSLIPSSSPSPASSPSPLHPTFLELGVPQALASRLAADGIDTPFPIQAATLPDALAGLDVLGRGRTGSGKTLAFTLPLVARLAGSSRSRPRRPSGLVLAPTRELATQIEKVVAPLAEAAGLRTVTVFGGVPAARQVRALQAGADIVVACPGRLADLMSSGHVDLGDVRVTVLDEADHMADLGFLPVVRRLLDATPRTAQRLLFSATLDRGVDVLVKRYLRDPVVHEVDTAQSPVPTLAHHVLHVSAERRLDVVADLAAAPGRTVVFTRTKRGAKRVARQLTSRGVSAVELHGDLAQNARTRNLQAFASGDVSALVATDIAARGIHVDDVALVVHADPPAEHKAYLHRSGRTARAGESGTVVTLVLDDQVSAVNGLMRQAGIRPVTSRVTADTEILSKIAPGRRTYGTPTTAPRETSARSSAEVRHRPKPKGSGKPRSRGPRRSAAPARAGAGAAPARSHSAAGFSSSARAR